MNSLLFIAIGFILLLSLVENLQRTQWGGQADHHLRVNRAMNSILRGCPKEVEPPEKTNLDPEFCIKLFTINPVKQTLTKKVTIDQCPQVIKRLKMFSYYVALPNQPFSLAERGDCYTARKQSDGTFLLESVKYRKNYVSVDVKSKRIFLRPLKQSDSSYHWELIKGLDQRQTAGVSIRLAKTTDQYILTDGNRLTLQVVPKSDQNAAKKTKSTVNEPESEPEPEPESESESERTRYLGCYRDRDQRALTGGPKKYGYDREKCSQACKDYRYFALQNNGWCSCSNSLEEATRYGKHNTCPENRTGGPWGNDLFENLPAKKPKPKPKPKPKQNISSEHLTLAQRATFSQV
jgi:hypothetical protein